MEALTGKTVPDSARWYRLSAPGDQHTALWRPFHGQVTVVAATWILEDPARWSIYCYNMLYIYIYVHMYIYILYIWTWMQVCLKI